MPNAFTVRSYDELIAMIPHTLGFEPRESMVCLAIGGGPTARVDLPTSPDEIEPWLQSLTEVYLELHRPARVALVAYGEDAGRSVGALAALSDALTRGVTRGVTGGVTGGAGSGPDVGPALWVNGDQWTDMSTGQHAILDQSARARIDAEFALMGRVMPAASREDLGNALKGDPTGVVQHLPAARDRFDHLDESGVRRETEWLGTRLDRFHQDREYPSDIDAARILTGITHTEVRDSAVIGLRRSEAAVSTELWRDLVRRAPEEIRDPAATLLALTSWLDGRGAQAWVALDELSEPNTLGDLVAAALQHAVDPRVWDNASSVINAALMQRAALGETPDWARSTHPRPLGTDRPGHTPPDTPGPDVGR